MLKSMTAFGRARRTVPDGSRDVTAEIKSVNSRYMDCTVKTPRGYSFLEEKARAYLSEKGVSRGKVDLYVGANVIEEQSTVIALDKAYAENYIAALRELREEKRLEEEQRIAEAKAKKKAEKEKKREKNRFLKTKLRK